MQNRLVKYEEIHTNEKRDFLTQKISEINSKIHKSFKRQKKIDNCPVCNGIDIKKYVTKYKFNMDKCYQCQHIFTNPFPSKDALNFFYNSEFKDFENKFFLESFENRIPIFTKRLGFMSIFKDIKKILDVGSAVGIFIEANIRSEFNYKIDVCDISKNACEILKKNYPDINIFNQDLCEVKLGNYDAVTLWDTLEHLVDPSIFLKSIWNQLRKNGYLFLSTPNTRSFEWEVMGKDHIQLLPPGHVNLYNVNNIKKILNKNNFSVVDIFTPNPSLDLTYVLSELGNKVENNSNQRALKYINHYFKKSDCSNFLNAVANDQFAGNMFVIAQKI